MINKLAAKNIAAPATPTTYIAHPTPDSSSKADVMITAVRTYLDMSIIKSEIFSQTEILFTKSFPMANLIYCRQKYEADITKVLF